MRKAGDVCFAEVTRDSDGALISTFLSFLFQLRAAFVFGILSLCLFFLTHDLILNKYGQERMVLLITPIMMT